jgi:hypothetical protein
MYFIYFDKGIRFDLQRCFREYSTDWRLNGRLSLAVFYVCHILTIPATINTTAECLRSPLCVQLHAWESRCQFTAKSVCDYVIKQWAVTTQHPVTLDYGAVFSVRSVPRLHSEDRWVSLSWVEILIICKTGATRRECEHENIRDVRIRYQSTTGVGIKNETF